MLNAYIYVCVSNYLPKNFPALESWRLLHLMLDRILVVAVVWLVSSYPVLKSQFLSDTFPSSLRQLEGPSCIIPLVTVFGSESSSFLGSQHLARIKYKNFIHLQPLLL